MLPAAEKGSRTIEQIKHKGVGAFIQFQDSVKRDRIELQNFDLEMIPRVHNKRIRDNSPNNYAT